LYLDFKLDDLNTLSKIWIVTADVTIAIADVMITIADVMITIADIMITIADITIMIAAVMIAIAAITITNSQVLVEISQFFTTTLKNLEDFPLSFVNRNGAARLAVHDGFGEGAKEVCQGNEG
jgi:hypothetical protein